MFDFAILFGFGGLFAFVTLFALTVFRRVVATNEVHIVQSRKHTTSYGKDFPSGNTYYEWPSWLPGFGVTKIVLPVSNFDVDLEAYEAYDVGRLPFVVDIKAFFRISDSNIAAQRVSDFKELHQQLQAVVQGAVRTILASADIEDIMQGRSKFGDDFTKEVGDQLVNWGVTAVKNIELMDIRDTRDSQVIHNIMAKKKSHIEMESRQEVAKNHRAAQIAEIEANRDVATQQQEAAETVGLRTVAANQKVELAEEAKLQAVKEQQKLTMDKEMGVKQIASVRAAEIDKNVKLVNAAQEKETTVLIAEGKLEAKKREAEGITLQGEAEASARRAMELAPVQAQIELAKEIGENQAYQEYLVTIRKVEMAQEVGKEQAKALEKADIKIISNSGDPVQGVTNVMDLFTSKGGTQLAGFLESLTNSGALSKLTGTDGGSAETTGKGKDKALSLAKK